MLVKHDPIKLHNNIIKYCIAYQDAETVDVILISNQNV